MGVVGRIILSIDGARLGFGHRFLLVRKLLGLVSWSLQFEQIINGRVDQDEKQGPGVRLKKLSR